MFENLGIDVILGTAAIYEHILATQLNEQKVAVQKPIPVTVIEQHRMCFNAVFANDYTEKRTWRLM